MTEKDLQEPIQRTPQVNKKNDTKEAFLSEEEIDSKEENVSEKTADSEEDSDFLAQWKERHQAYLESQKEPSVEEDTEHEEVKEDQASVLPKQHDSQEADKEVYLGVDTDEEQPSLSKKKRIPLSKDAILKSLSIFFLAIVGILLSSYFISPLSKEKQIEITGNQILTTEEILAYSQISDRDYAVTTFLSRHRIEEIIKSSSNLVEADTITFQFPNRFIIEVKEYPVVGYLEEGNGYRLVLSSGNISDKVVTAEQLPEVYTVIHLSDQDLIKKLALQLAAVDSSIVSLIQTIDLTPSKSTADLLTLTMYDGHKVLVPLSEIERKLPYYSKIAPQLSLPSTIDMEVGIFSYAN